MWKSGEMKIHVISGLPGSGKSTYCKGQMNPKTIVYDMDEIAKALDYGTNTQKSRTIANRLIVPLIDECENNNVNDLFIIRTTPSMQELEIFSKYRTDYTEMCQVYTKRDISKEDWDRIVFEHEKYLKRVNPRMENEEKW